MTGVMLNADMGEGCGDDAALMPLVDAANIACGGHAGDTQMMAATIALARQHEVRIGAHPGFEDRTNFGRKRVDLSADAITALVAGQTAALIAIARLQGVEVGYVKPHGALYNWAAENKSVAAACVAGVASLDAGLAYMGAAASAHQAAAEEAGLRFIAEIFLDRAMDERGLLVSRSEPGAVLHDADEAAARIMAMLKAGGLFTASGRLISTRIDSICVHGDTPGAVAMAKRLAERLRAVL